jgi:hypothetical protein
MVQLLAVSVPANQINDVRKQSSVFSISWLLRKELLSTVDIELPPYSKLEIKSQPQVSMQTKLHWFLYLPNPSGGLDLELNN